MAGLCLTDGSLLAIKNTVVQDAWRPNHVRRRSASEISNPSAFDCRCSRTRKSKGSMMRSQPVTAGPENSNFARQAGQPFKRPLFAKHQTKRFTS